ncbi:MAG TPA: sugar phosphate nucleotidyltransferase, partial [Nitrospira sp.]
VYKKRHGAVLGVQEVPKQDVGRYGIVTPTKLGKGLHRVDDLVEKPSPAEAASNLAVIGRYILPPEIFPILRKTRPGKNGEIQLTDALKELAKKNAYVCPRSGGTPPRCRRQVGFLNCNGRVCA